MSSTDTADTKLNFERRRQLDGYPAATDLIPLNKPGRKVRMPNGKTVAVGKAPLHSGWQKRAYDPVAVVADALANGNNLGVRLHSDHLVVDVDVRAGGDQGWSALCHDVGIDENLYATVRTPTGGRHICMSIPEGTLVRDTLENDQYRGVEFKSRGRQVVAAGSAHPQGGMYRWQGPTLKELGWVAAPRGLVKMIKRPPRAAIAGGGQFSNEQIAKMLATMPPEAFREQSKWLQILQACHHASSGEARFEFIAWSITDPKFAYDADVIGRRWDSLDANRNDGVTYRTLCMFVRDHGDAATIPPNDIADDFDCIADVGDDFVILRDGV